MIEVIDQSGMIFDNLKGNSEIVYTLSERTLEQAIADKEHFGVLHIGEDIITNSSNIALYTNSASSMMLESNITSAVNKLIESERLKAYNIENLDQILKDVKANASIKAIRTDSSSGEQKGSSAAVAMGISYGLGFILYMFLIIYGSMVMTSVIEEKGSRVLEVLVSSVKPFDLLMGKIFSIALVAITQIAIWGLLATLMVAVVIPMLLPADLAGTVQAMQASGGVVTAEMAAVPGFDAELIGVMAALTDMSYISNILIFAVIFLIGGYLLYSAMFAAVGSSVDTMEDAQNLQLPIMLPIIISLAILTMVAKDPNATIIQIFSMIPLSSPIIMIARIPHGIPTWEILLSLTILYASFVGMVWIASRIYRVGIFMHGKKPTFKELYRWVRESGE